MPTSLDPRMISNNVPLRINGAEIKTLSADLFATSTATINNLNATNLVNTNLLVTNLTATNNVVSSFFVLTANTNLTFTQNDNAKTYHINTTLTPLVTAAFSATLQDGFNVGLINVGTGVILLSTETTLNATGTVNSTQNTGVLIYKHNGQFYGIGAFE